MLLLAPKLAILDELDSGLDVDALKDVATAVAQAQNTERALLLITHYERLLTYIKPDVVHVMVSGVLVASGGQDLVERIEHEGNAWLIKQSA